MSRSLIEKLETMAARGTEHEREVAAAKLTALRGRRPPPPRPPTAVGASPMPFGRWASTMTNNGTSSTASYFIRNAFIVRSPHS